MKFKSSQLKIESFTELSLNEQISSALKGLGIVQPTQIQKIALPNILTGQDLIGLAETGSGKTLSYVLPLLLMLEKNQIKRGLILLPNRELATQVFQVVKKINKDIAADVTLIIGGKKMDNQSRQLKKKPRIVIATPGRLYDHLSTNKLLLEGVQYLVIDEAERMLDSGFAPQLQNIHRCLRGKVQVLLFSASINSSVEKVFHIFMSGQPILIKDIGADKPVEKLKQEVHFLQKEQKNNHLHDLINQTRGQMIIFVINQENCENIYQYFDEYGVEISFIHGGLSQGARNRAIQAFQSKAVQVIVTTDMLSRGLDFPDVEHVISYDLPLDPSDYLHRIGRTARAGKSGLATVFITPNLERNFLKIKKYLVGANEIKVDPQFLFRISNKPNRQSIVKNQQRPSRPQDKLKSRLLNKQT